ncbi:MAG: hypothetical protein MZV64_37255 [Ignavibacteriales bacterium]|nr:hypothetical protein [Ignavibacteriales bacterium]
MLYKEEKLLLRNLESQAVQLLRSEKGFYEIENSFIGREARSRNIHGNCNQAWRKSLETTGLRWSTTYKLPVVQQNDLYQLLERNARGISE